MIYIVVKNKVIDRSDFATADITSWDEIIFASTDKTEAVTAAGKAAYKMFPQPANGHAILRWSSTPDDFARQDWVVLLELHEGSKTHVLCRPNMLNYDQTQNEFTFFTDDDIKFATINLDHYSATLLENILLFIDTTSSDGKFSTIYSTTESANIVYNVSNRLKELGFHTSIKTYHSLRSDLITISWQSFYITKYGTMAWKIWERTHNIVSSSYDSMPQELITNILTIDDIISATQGLFNVDAANLFAKALIAIDASITKGYFTASLSTNESSTLVKDVIDQLDRLGFNTTSVIDSNPLQITIEWDPKSIKKDTVAWNFYEKTCKIRNSSSFTKDYNEVEQDLKDKSDNIDIFYEENLITAAEARSAATKNSTQILDIYNKLFNDITNAINDSIAKGRYETFIGIENNQNSDYQEAMKRIIQLLSNKGYIYNKNYEKMCLEIKW